VLDGAIFEDPSPLFSSGEQGHTCIPVAFQLREQVSNPTTLRCKPMRHPIAWQRSQVSQGKECPRERQEAGKAEILEGSFRTLCG
jgi:hypothetical protein